MLTDKEIFQDKKYQIVTRNIQTKRDHNSSWEQILSGSPCSSLDSFLDQFYQVNDVQLSKEEWIYIVERMREIESKSEPGFIGTPKKQLLDSPIEEKSSWQMYKNHLIDEGFSADGIAKIEMSTRKVVSQLDHQTDKLNPVRGVVVGNVQSGKTANMAGVIAMASDYGFNFFIVLTGTIDNLRKQTEERLIRDLTNVNSNLNLMPLHYLSGDVELSNALSSLSLQEESNKRYLYVCLKNSSRLDDLLVWLNSDSNKKHLKVVLIDDEVDQAGVNTKDVDSDLDPTRINGCIKKMVFCKTKKDEDSPSYSCMNYIGYSATPYANLLNEAKEYSLYPKNFIVTLPSPQEYIGPKEIFGMPEENPGMPIVNIIPPNDITNIQKLGTLSSIPDSLKESISWFICSIACFRFWKIKKPVSMLIHTSQSTKVHSIMGNAVTSFLDSLRHDKKYHSYIEKIYERQKSLFTIDDFFKSMVDFPKELRIKELPSFSEIKNLVDEIINNGFTRIELNEDESRPVYNNGIHVCIDNCYHNKIQNNIIMRIIYPDPNNAEVLKNSPAFIVIGGSTLSRGLTLQGLTTSYFLRTTSLADALMQMGRWFGYRRGYELLPRIWISSNVKKQFEYLTVMDEGLREELHSMEIRNQEPTSYAPRLMSFPRYMRMQPTANNKSQKAIEVHADFSNKQGQTTSFWSDENIIRSNYDHMLHFINDLGPVDKQRIASMQNGNPDTTFIWFGVSYSKIMDLMKVLNYPRQSALIGDPEQMKEWFAKQQERHYLKDFNVVLASVEEGRALDLENLSIKLPTRRKIVKENDDGTIIDLKILTSPNDRVLDVNVAELTDDEKYLFKNPDKNVTSIQKRNKFRLINTPLLVIYIIDKDSGKDKQDTETRAKLNLSCDLVGYYIYIPYGNDGKVRDVESNGMMSVELEFDNKEDIEEDVED